MREDSDYRDYTRVASARAPYVLAPGSTIHGITRERITLPATCAASWRGAAASRGSA